MAPSVTKKAIKVTDERTAESRRELKGCLVWEIVGLEEEKAKQIV